VTDPDPPSSLGYVFRVVAATAVGVGAFLAGMAWLVSGKP
jgi:hypothetical protein